MRGRLLFRAIRWRAGVVAVLLGGVATLLPPAAGGMAQVAPPASAPVQPVQAHPDAKAAPLRDANAASQTPEAAPPAGTVIFSRELPLDADAQAAKQTAPAQAVVALKPAASNQDDSLKVTDAERDALTFTAYDLDVHLMPASAGISVRAAILVRNDSAESLARIVLQISSTMHWEAFSSANAAQHAAATEGATMPLRFAVHSVATDADHTGYAEEAVVTLPQSLAPGKTIALTALYFGAIPPSAERLQRIGAPDAQALLADWDAIAVSNPDAPGSTDAPRSAGALGGGTALRGFGNVLWYPVAAPPVFLGDGAKLFQAVGRSKLRQMRATIRLRLAVEYVGDPPDAAFFCGRREALTAIHDNPNVPVAEAPGVATAVFGPQPLGFRSPSLFVTDHPASEVDPAANIAGTGSIAAVTEHYDGLASYSAAAALVEPMLADWFGARSLTKLNLLDHPGQPFEDDTLLVRPMRVEEAATLAPSLAHSLTHAWIQSSQPWIDEGLAQFAGMLWTERSAGPAAALNQLEDAARSLALAEPEVPASDTADRDANASKSPNLSKAAASPSPAGAPTPNSFSSSNPPPQAGVSGATDDDLRQGSSAAGQSLLAASGEIFYRTKAAAVWWMLRGLAGDPALKRALQAYRRDSRLDSDPEGFERTLEKFAQRDLRWFFDDWVYRDRGLADLTIVNVTPRQLEARGGQPAGWLVSVVVRNDGYAEVEVPVTVRSGTRVRANPATETQRLRIPGRAIASTRIVFANTPEEVQVNDGGIPEARANIHTWQLIPSGR